MKPLGGEARGREARSRVGLGSQGEPGGLAPGGKQWVAGGNGESGGTWGNQRDSGEPGEPVGQR